MLAGCRTGCAKYVLAVRAEIKQTRLKTLRKVTCSVPTLEL